MAVGAAVWRGWLCRSNGNCLCLRLRALCCFFVSQTAECHEFSALENTFSGRGDFIHRLLARQVEFAIGLGKRCRDWSGGQFFDAKLQNSSICAEHAYMIFSRFLEKLLKFDKNYSDSDGRSWDFKLAPVLLG